MMLRKAIFTALLLAGVTICPTMTPAGQMGTILVSDLRMRAGPGKEYRIVRFLPKGARVLVLEARQGWLAYCVNNSSNLTSRGLGGRASPDA